MPFITQGKTNWKFLLIVVVFAAIVGGGVLWFTEQQKIEELTDGQITKLIIREILAPEEPRIFPGQITEISVDGDIKKIEKIQLPIGKEEAKMIVKTFCEPKILLGKYEYEEIKQNYQNWWRIPIFDFGCLYGATVDPQTGYTYCTKDVARVSFSESLSDRETADWQIYRDEEYRFEFKYPKDWKLVEQTTNFSEEVEAGTRKKIYLTSPIKWEMGDPLGIGEDWGEATAQLDFTIILEEESEEGNSVSCWEIIFPSNILAITFEDVTDISHHTYIYIPSHFDDQFFIKIFGVTPSSLWEIEEFNQVLSTFRFME